MRAEDFTRFDLVVVMDEGNRVAASSRAAAAQQAKVRRMLEFWPEAVARGWRDVPDPYAGGAADFERVLDWVEAASEGLLAYVQTQLTPSRR